MDIVAQVLTPYTPARTPQILQDYPHPVIQICNDVTGIDYDKLVPEINLYVVEIETDEQTINEIASNPAYFVVWQEQKSEIDGE